MNTKLFLISIAFVTGLFFTSCEKEDEISKPQINDVELGTNNSKIGIIGSDLHVEAEVVAEAKINTIQIQIHQEEKNGGWTFDSIYTEFSGLKNTTFHKHIDISSNADTGIYHFHFIVTDMDGNQTTIEEEMRIINPTDLTAPVITISNAPTSNQYFSNGQTISISGIVSDDISLAGMYIGLVREGQNLADADVNDENTITIMHTHEFDNPTSHSFSANIIVGATQDNNITPKDIIGDIAWQSGNYYIVVKCKDTYGGNWTYSSHYPIIINY